MTIIKLPTHLANQISAGEVIERPASVVKELIENAIDAKSNHITIHLERGGAQLIKITDTGTGISSEELSLALSSHATSKIKSLQDLATIESYGFRGEALASIAAISKISITSASENAQAYKIQGDARSEIEPSTHLKGTTIEVRELFYNTPVRRKFLRTERTEYERIDVVIKQAALANFNVGVTLIHNNKQVYTLAQAHTQEAKDKRVRMICGKSFLESASYININAMGLSLSGWLGNPSFSKSSSDLQYFYVNSRILKDKVLNHALRQAYSDHIPEGRYPGFILYLSIDPSEVDINVHPTKHEVRFENARLVHDFVYSSLQKVLQEEPIEQNSSVEETQSSNMLQRTLPIGDSVKKPLLSSFSSASKARTRGHFKETASTPTTSVFSNPVGFYHDYYLGQEQEGLLIIDIKAAVNYHVYLYFNQHVQSNSVTSKPLLIPKTIVLENTAESLMGYADELQSFGILYDMASANELILRYVPAIHGIDIDFIQLFNVLEEKMKLFSTYDAVSLIDALSIQLALQSMLIKHEHINAKELEDTIGYLIDYSKEKQVFNKQLVYNRVSFPHFKRFVLNTN